MQLTEKFKRSVSMLTWGYNEEGLVAEFLDRALALLAATVHDYELVFVDDGSTDRTPDIVAAYAQQEPRLRLLINEKNVNVGLSCRRAVAAAQKEFLFWQTVDWSYDLTHLRLFLELLNYFDVVQGIRPTPEKTFSHIPILRSFYRAGARSDNLKKAFVSLCNYYLLRLLYGVDFEDFQNITFYPTALAQSLTLVGRSSFINPELLIKSYARGVSFLEVPIPFLPRRQGEAKGTKLKAVLRSIKDVFGNWFAWGCKLRLGLSKNQKGTIHRVSRPFFLDEKVLTLVLPLLKYYR